jgi:phage-related protein
MSILGDLQKQNGGAWVELYELDATAQGGSVLYFHAGTNGLSTSVVWQGNTYAPFPINASGFEISGQQMPRPKLAVANVSGAITALLQTSDLLGAKVTRRRTMVKYLDAVNFPAQRNLLTRTAGIGGTGWTNESYSGTLTTNYSVAPDGTTTATYYNLVGGYSYQQITLTAGVTYTFSCYVRGTPATGKGIGVWSYAVAGIIATSTQAINNSTWTRCTVTFTANTTSNFAMMVVGVPANVFRNVEVWGAQLEIGALTDYQPVLGATFSRNPTADANSHLADEIYYVAQKTQENHAIVEFELGSPIDLEGVTIPRRQIVANLCLWQYRGDGCGYAGGAVADEFDVPTAVLANDKCSKRLSGCTLRFGSNSELPYGGFPSAGLTKL